MTAPEPFAAGERVRGYLHRAGPDGLVLVHGAGSNANAPLLVETAEQLAAAGLTVLRCDLPFRQARAGGSPRPGDAKNDRQGLRDAVAALRSVVPGRAFLGGVSYGGRQASILASEAPGLVSALLLLSYPLHPPGKPEQLRTAHLPDLRTPALFVHGVRDPFGSPEEMRAAIRLIPARSELVLVEKAGHDLASKDRAAKIARFMYFIGQE